MELITVHTAQNIDIDYEIGGLGERIVARIIDLAIALPVIIIAAIIWRYLSETGLIILYVTLSIIFVFYHLFCEVVFNGQSLGKKVMNIRVISLDGGRPRFSQFLLRWLFRLIDFDLGGGAIALITAIMTDRSQRLGDLVAGTALIRTIPRTTMSRLFYVATPQNYEPVFQQAIELSDKDAALINEVIGNYIQTGNTLPVHNLAAKVREHLSVTTPPEMNSMQFLQTMLRDYSHIISRMATV